MATPPPPQRRQQQHQQPTSQHQDYAEGPKSKRQRKAEARLAGTRAPPPPAPPAPRPRGGGGTGFCHPFNVGRCSAAACPNGFVHKCAVCHEAHTAIDVPACAARVDAMGRALKGKGKGKGK